MKKHTPTRKDTGIKVASRTIPFIANIGDVHSGQDRRRQKGVNRAEFWQRFEAARA